MVEYHDTEWGVPVHDDPTHFEFLVLEGAQAGLSWRTVLNKRAAYRYAFHGFDIARVARMTDAALEKLLLNPDPCNGVREKRLVKESRRYSPTCLESMCLHTIARDLASAHLPSKRASSTTPILPMRVAWTRSGPCTPGSTGRQRGATSMASGGSVMMNTASDRNTY